MPKKPDDKKVQHHPPAPKFRPAVGTREFGIMSEPRGTLAALTVREAAAYDTMGEGKRRRQPTAVIKPQKAKGRR